MESQSENPVAFIRLRIDRTYNALDQFIVIGILHDTELT